MAKERLKQIPLDFWAMNCWPVAACFWSASGTIVFPVITSVRVRNRHAPIWGLRGFSVLILHGLRRSYPIPRFYSVIGSAGDWHRVVAVVVVAPVPPLYRNDHPLHEGRNFLFASRAGADPAMARAVPVHRLPLSAATKARLRRGVL